MRPERSEVIAVGSAISPISIGAALGAAFGIGRLLSGWPAWAAAGFAATVTYLLISGMEMALAHRAEQRREEVRDADEGEDG